MDDNLKKLAIKLGTDGPHKTLPTPRMVKLLFNGSYILKTTHAHYVWEHPYYPHFYVPLAELQSTSSKTNLTISERETYHSPSDHKTVLAHQLSLTVGTKSTSNVLAFPATLTEGPAAPLAGLVRIAFDSLDAWFEEDTPILVHPKDPFKRLDILASTRPIRVLINGVLVAETSTSAHLYETGLPCRFYLPFSALLDPGVLRASATRTRCPYKGEAEYWSVEVGGTVYEDVIWYYRTPTMESAAVAGLVCFYNEKVDIELDGKMLERPDTRFGKSKPSENQKPSAV
ncbi:hypothetical protein LTR48_004341 [Friedmanniomyces endolithicus]|uniref:DUF427 domain-containing protein n=1 Tax=Rachicladosporium monterosium TaxID=1507873 RepID=A0ABR0L5I4_9PEZI|nr:hypothetical protein LTR29_011073 [Friedmanniomyces endolithicus]KAK1092442.1 hypothetical protein LTR48_004341 [Friedmanniomyces endolithicus]KAK5143823.1 hypothetical protein LTR32_004135 [Rachicladosporium monterosium]